MKNAIGYCRVSTQRQGKSGLGLEAQQSAIRRFAEAEGYTIDHTFVEVETGKGADALDRRPQLAAAMKAARKNKAAILVAKLDRLSRDVHFISGLMTHKVRFLVAELGPRSVYAACLRGRRRTGAPAHRRPHAGSPGSGQEARREVGQPCPGQSQQSRCAAAGAGFEALHP
jgi:Resolvase, N terminal domain